jgi:transposase InsO family protein
MTEELKALGFDDRHCRVGRLMPVNGIEVKPNKKFKATTDSNHSFNIAPNLLRRPPMHAVRTGNGPVASAMSGRREDGSIWPSFPICIPGG